VVGFTIGALNPGIAKEKSCGRCSKCSGGHACKKAMMSFDLAGGYKPAMPGGYVGTRGMPSR
jgi:hypothetical protein